MNAKGLGLELFIHQQVERQAALHPEWVALAFEDESLSYGELNRRANRLGHHLVELGAGPDSRVALWMDRGMDLLVGILATLKAGAAYVPLDPAYPAERLAYMLEDCAPAAVLTQQRLCSELPASAAQVITIDSDATALKKQPDSNLDAMALGLRPQNLACLIYTSGSTGLPKGVMLHHAGLRQLVNIQADLFEIRSDSRILQFSSPSFDASLLDITMALCHGARLCLAPQEALRPGAPLVDTLRGHGITHVTLPPSALAALGSGVRFPTVKTLVVAGEVCPPAVTREWAPRHRLINIYGPTETTVFVTAEVCQPEYAGSTPIGRPVGPARLYILDRDLQPVAAGDRGELFVGGVCVSRGYHNKPELTAQRFIKDPFSAERDARMYKTGDTARWLPDGKIEYIGRSDFQVKLRGFRIELGEIEARLAACAGVREAVVVCREDVPGDKRLVAYLTATGEHLAIEPLRAQLKRFLPEHMLPAAWVRLDRFPLTPNGKTDRSALPAPQASAFQTAAFEAPVGELEAALADIWQEVLRVEAVGRLDNFFALGGHSLLATQMVSRVQARMQVDLPLRMVFEQPRLDALAAWLAVARHRAEDAGPRSGLPRIRRVPRGGPLPCSYSQRRMWMVQQITPETTAYNIALALRLHGALETSRLTQAIDLVARRHEAFRTRFELVDGEPMQVLTAHPAVELAVVDLRGIAAGERDDQTRRVLGDFTVLPFDLSTSGLHRTLLVRLNESEHVLLWVMHHIIGDLWSCGLLLHDLKRAYAELLEAGPAELPPLALEYADFAAWQREQVHEAALARQLDHWRTRLRDLPPLHLPTDFPRRGPLSGRGGTVHAALSPASIESLKQFSNRHGTTPFVTLLACFQLMLARRSGQCDFAVGVPVANRHHIESEQLVGTLVNTLVMRNDLSGDPSFAGLLARVHETALQAFANQDTPFEHLVEQLAGRRDKLHSPLVQVMFNVVNAPFSLTDFADFQVDHFAFDQRAAQFDLSLSVDVDVFGQVQLEYSSDLFVHVTAERLVSGFLALLDAVLADPKRPIRDYPLLGAAEQADLVRWNRHAHAYPRARRVDQLISDGAARWPRRKALQDGARSLTHAELHKQSNRLARELRYRGIRRGAMVGLCVERSVATVVALLAVLKAGAAYVPLDPVYPAERLSCMAQDARLDLLVAESATLAALEWPSSRSLLLDLDAGDIERHSGDALADDSSLDARPEDPAYVIYTSGSSGKPKGVVVLHRAVVNFLTSMARQPGLQPTDRLLAVTTLSFDIAVLELLLPLSVGARVVIASHEETHDGNALRAKLESSEATVMQATPASWQMLISAGWQGSPTFRALIGGEALAPELAKQLLLRSGELWNMYGPTETTVWSTCWRVHDPETGICIGTPIANTQVHVLDERQQPCPIGVPGELCIAGDGVALGYFHRQDLSAERFLADPFSAAGTLYRTGDRGRWRHDGQLEHLGRFDFQVKLRGHRIELGEIEANLSSHEQVAQCMVVMREDEPGDARLVAYVTPKNGMPQVGELRQRLRRKLPEYMVPQHFVVLDALPLLPNGKVDRAALPSPTEAAVPHDSEFRVPRTDAEAAVAQIWQRLLGLERVSTGDNFFDLGGHSLLAMRAVSEMHKRLGVRISLRRMVFETLAQLAADAQAPDSKPATPAKARSVKYLVGGLQRMLLSKGLRDTH